VLASILFTDIVGATERAATYGDHAWRQMIERHHAVVRGLLVRFRGVEVDTAGDGFFATFDGPARAVRCALAIVEAVRALGIEIRAGVHTGEVETINEKVGGIAVSIGARGRPRGAVRDPRVPDGEGSDRGLRSPVRGSGRVRAEGCPGPLAAASGGWLNPTSRCRSPGSPEAATRTTLSLNTKASNCATSGEQAYGHGPGASL
jgi:hypothetical protein